MLTRWCGGERAVVGLAVTQLFSERQEITTQFVKHGKRAKVMKCLLVG